MAEGPEKMKLSVGHEHVVREFGLYVSPFLMIVPSECIQFSPENEKIRTITSEIIDDKNSSVAQRLHTKLTIRYKRRHSYIRAHRARKSEREREREIERERERERERKKEREIERKW